MWCGQVSARGPRGNNTVPLPRVEAQVRAQVEVACAQRKPHPRFSCGHRVGAKNLRSLEPDARPQGVRGGRRPGFRIQVFAPLPRPRGSIARGEDESRLRVVQGVLA
jgi:hypothetical protein